MLILAQFLIAVLLLSQPTFGSKSAHAVAKGKDKNIDRSAICTKRDQIVDGMWEEMPQSYPMYDKKEFVCCGYDKGQWEINNQSYCGEDGSGYDDDRRHFMGGHGCHCDTNHNTRISQSRRERYIWRPKTCSLPTWNALEFCGLLRNRTILMVGDSTMQQSAATVLSMLRVANASCSDNIIFRRADFLYFPANKWSKTWLQYAQIVEDPDIVILSSGAHYHDFGEFVEMWDHLINQIEEYKKVSKAQKKKEKTFIWRTICPGHYNCDNITAPHENFAMVPKGADIFKWNHFPAYDFVGINRAIKANMKVIDMSPLYMRGDSHPTGKDCLRK